MRPNAKRRLTRAGLRIAPALGLLVLLALPACAQRPVLKTGLETEGKLVRDVFAPVVAEARRATVRLHPAEGGDPVALGLVISDTGAVLTKASELRDAEGRPLAVIATLADGRSLPLVRVATDPRSDLAVLRAEPAVTGLVFIDPAGDATAAVPEPGSWVAVPGLDAAPDAVGIVSARPRATGRRCGWAWRSFRPRGRGRHARAAGGQRGAGEYGRCAGGGATRRPAAASWAATSWSKPATSLSPCAT